MSFCFSTSVLKLREFLLNEDEKQNRVFISNKLEIQLEKNMGHN